MLLRSLLFASLLAAPLFIVNCEGDPDVADLAREIRAEFDHTLRTPGVHENRIRLTIEPEAAFDNDEDKAHEIARFAFNAWKGEPVEGVVIIMETATGSGVMDAANREEFEFTAEELK